MQTFLPYDDFEKSAAVLDYRRLGKQRVEAYQILRRLRGLSKGWGTHPAVLMWKGYEGALADYMNVCIAEWKRRGFKNTMLYEKPTSIILPPWFGLKEFHLSHQSKLLSKDAEFYGPKFPGVPSDLPYFWPK